MKTKSKKFTTILHPSSVVLTHIYCKYINNNDEGDITTEYDDDDNTTEIMMMITPLNMMMMITPLNMMLSNDDYDKNTEECMSSPKNIILFLRFFALASPPNHEFVLVLLYVYIYV